MSPDIPAFSCRSCRVESLQSRDPSEIEPLFRFGRALLQGKRSLNSSLAPSVMGRLGEVIP
ncbi:hypothetical protein M072_3950 [Bacteroides fragilis str. DS-208]|nr:hypothetical protein M072_3950 [Bacteroides fragilis str. DS-208]